MSKGTATLVKPLGGTPWRCYLWRCDPPLEGHEFVVTSYPVPEAERYVGAEIYAFSSDENGAITNWGELDISQKGRPNTPTDHAAIFRDAGWETA